MQILEIKNVTETKNLLGVSTVDLRWQKKKKSANLKTKLNREEEKEEKATESQKPVV